MTGSIQAARRWIQSCEESLATAKERVKEERENLGDAIRSLYRAIDDEAAGVQELPLGEPEAKGEATETHHGWDLATSRPLTDEQEAAADFQAATEAEKRKSHKRSKAKA